jgi:hypothetical protein
MLELILGLHTHVFFGTLGSGVVQNDSIVEDSWPQAAGRFSTQDGWCRLGAGEVGQGSTHYSTHHTGATNIQAHSLAKQEQLMAFTTF